MLPTLLVLALALTVAPISTTVVTPALAASPAAPAGYQGLTNNAMAALMPAPAAARPAASPPRAALAPAS